MKLCPNPTCRTRVRARTPAEFEDWATRCNDCDAPLVPAEELNVAATEAMVARWREEQEAAGATVTYEHDKLARRARSDGSSDLDVWSGAAMMVLGLVGVAFGWFFYRAWVILPVMPMVFGALKFFRGAEARRQRPKKDAPRLPYR